MMTKERIAAAVERVPEVKPVLAKLAGKMARGVALPAQFSEKNLSYAAQRELEVLWCVAGNVGWTRVVSAPGGTACSVRVA